MEGVLGVVRLAVLDGPVAQRCSTAAVHGPFAGAALDAAKLPGLRPTAHQPSAGPASLFCRLPSTRAGTLKCHPHLPLAGPCSGEHTYAYARLPNLIQGQGQLSAKLVFQPASLQSNLHRQMRAATDKLHVKTQKVCAAARVFPPSLCSGPIPHYARHLRASVTVAPPKKLQY